MNRELWNVLRPRLRKTKAGCWEFRWNRKPHKRCKYGTLTTVGTYWYAHRLAWLIFYGPIPKGKWVLHKCDNPPCCNPAHLFLGTTQDNTADRDAKGRTAKGERSGNAKLTDAQVRAIRSNYDGKVGSQQRLAKKHAVSTDYVLKIVRGWLRKEAGPLAIQRCDKRKLPEIDKRFGRLTVIKPGARIGRNTASVCRCRCGNVSRYQNSALRGGRRTACRRCERLTRSK